MNDGKKKSGADITEKEVEIIKSAFADNEYLLKVMRALFYGMGVTDEEKTMIKATFSNKPLRDIIWKRLLPSMSKDVPIGQAQDVWLGVEQMVFGGMRDSIEQAIQYKERSIVMTKQALNLLTDPSGQPVDISYDPNKHLNDPLAINLLARNQFMRHIESQLMFLLIIAGEKKESMKDAKNRLQLDSSK